MCWAKEFGEAPEEERVAQLEVLHEGQAGGGVLADGQLDELMKGELVLRESSLRKRKLSGYGLKSGSYMCRKREKQGSERASRDHSSWGRCSRSPCAGTQLYLQKLRATP